MQNKLLKTCRADHTGRASSPLGGGCHENEEHAVWVGSFNERGEPKPQTQTIAAAKVRRMLVELGYRAKVVEDDAQIFRDAAAIFNVSFDGAQGAFADRVIDLGPVARLDRAVGQMMKHPDRFTLDVWPFRCRVRQEAFKAAQRRLNTPPDPNSKRSQKAALPENVAKADKKAKRLARKHQRRQATILANVEQGLRGQIPMTRGRSDDRP